MLRSEIDGAILLADQEGEGRFYESIAHKNARVIPSPMQAVTLLKSLTTMGIGGVVAVLSNNPTSRNTGEFHPDLGDIASLLVCSSQFDRVLTSIAGQAWKRSAEKQIGCLVRHSARIVSAVCTPSNVKSVNLSPDELIELINWNNFELDTNKLNVFFDKITTKTIHDSFNLNAGQDLVALVKKIDGQLAIELISASMRLYQPNGLKSADTKSAHDLRHMLEVSFDFSDFENDSIFWNMRSWERRNAKYPILKQWRTLDPFRSVWDQRYWETDLNAILAHDKSRLGLSVIKLDLDNFKIINEKLGHTGGDEAIKLACSIIKRSALAHGEIYRRGGDEFVVIAPTVRGNEAKALAEELRSNIEEGFLEWSNAKGLTTSSTASIGLVDIDAGGNPAEIIRLMDLTQQQAKDEGKNRVICATYSNSN